MQINFENSAGITFTDASHCSLSHYSIPQVSYSFFFLDLHVGESVANRINYISILNLVLIVRLIIKVCLCLAKCLIVSVIRFPSGLDPINRIMLI